MREIKFRAWDEGNKVMHFNFQFIRSGLDGNDWILFISDKQLLIDDWRDNPYFAQQLKIMQFTGLKDKNGRDVYEGDILEFQNPKQIYCWHQGNRFTMKWEERDAKWYSFGPHNCFAVIGNIYENSELLEPAASDSNSDAATSKG